MRRALGSLVLVVTCGLTTPFGSARIFGEPAGVALPDEGATQPAATATSSAVAIGGGSVNAGVQLSGVQLSGGAELRVGVQMTGGAALVGVEVVAATGAGGRDGERAAVAATAACGAEALPKGDAAAARDNE